MNRGQGIAAFGTENKEHPLMEFSSANKAYQETPYVGFRTFLKGKRAILCDVMFVDTSLAQCVQILSQGANESSTLFQCEISTFNFRQT